MLHGPVCKAGNMQWNLFLKFLPICFDGLASWFCCCYLLRVIWNTGKNRSFTEI